MRDNCLTTTVNQAIREVTWRGRSASMPQIPVNRVGKERFVVISRRWRRYMSNISQASLFQSSSTNLSCPLDDLAFDKVELPVLACLALVLPMRPGRFVAVIVGGSADRERKGTGGCLDQSEPTAATSEPGWVVGSITDAGATLPDPDPKSSPVDRRRNEQVLGRCPLNHELDKPSYRAHLCKIVRYPAKMGVCCRKFLTGEMRSFIIEPH